MIGIDIGGSKILICVISPSGDICVKFSGPTTLGTSSEDLAGVINDVIGQLPNPPVAIGIAVPGLVQDGRIVVSDVLPKLSGWSPARSVAFKCPIVVLNDAEAALVEAATGLPQGSTAAMVMVGTGIGVALQIEGRIFRGARGWAGELGSVPTSPEGPLVTLDSVAAGGPLLCELGIETAGTPFGPDRVTQSDRTKIERAGRALGFGLATLINILNPDRIILGGGTFRFPGYLDSALEATRIRSLPQLWDACVIEMSSESEALVARGAAKHARSLL
ncbi:ROK family protein [Bradyrhizobium sp. 21]|uniref:ROK family protein n=1 Tax=Bradyrhizobium sp. 21 TaxID=2782666 RepID=UPI001FF76501|nr:ROK family protein [Bradyrhizobium sp. 21]MCK1384097.1 ROK family protein [Bradyrhizobium sp. 21]